ncbi:MAG: hypothetical protein LBU13_05920 [Synergistaceae bacterium]|jgi:hypothetical protein|nr:hypothetical protein [Synergistaceae bacterium]
MGISNITGNTQMDALFSMARDYVECSLKRADEAGQSRAREAFYKAVKSCDEAAERMMDKHLESVKKSAEKLAEYRKKKAITDRARKHAEDMRIMNENILVERINHRNMLEELRIRGLNEEELSKK